MQDLKYLLCLWQQLPANNENQVVVLMVPIKASKWYLKQTPLIDENIAQYYDINLKQE